MKQSVKKESLNVL